MARQDVQVIELDLRGGIQTDDSPLAIGPKLLESGDCGWQPFGLTEEVRRRILAFMPQRDLGQTVFSISPWGNILAVLALDPNGDFPIGGYALVANDEFNMGNCIIVDFTGNQFPVGSTLATLKDMVRSGWMIIWTGIAQTTVYFGHPAFGSVWQIVEPGGAPTPYIPTVSPFGGGSLSTDSSLDPTSLSAQNLAVGENPLPTGTYKLQITGTDANGKETNISDESAPVVIGANKALQFTVPNYTANYPHANLYAKKDAGPYVLQKSNIAPGVYHLNGNGASASAQIYSYKFNSTDIALFPTGLPLDAALDQQTIGLVSRIPPELNLANGGYQIAFVAIRDSDSVQVRSDESAVQTASNQVLSFKTTVAGYSQIDLYARKGAANSHLQNGALPQLTVNTTYRLNRTGGFIGSSGAFTGIAYVATGPSPGSALPNIIDGLIHLDRLWLLQSPGNGRSTAYYTDPIDPNTIRATSFIPIPADGTCMFRCNVGSIDPGAASHLLFGTTTSIWVLDGDPTTQSGVLRRLTFNVGIADKSCVAETSFGAVFLGTDGQFWIIPPGATQCLPLGHRMLAQHFTADFTSPRDSLAWLSPYVVYSRNDGPIFFADMSPIAAQAEPKWWGPVKPTPFTVDTAAAPGDTPDMVRLFGTTPEAGPDSSNSVFYAFHIDHISQLDVVTRGETGTLLGRFPRLLTGFLAIPDHKVELRRIVVETTAPDLSYTLTINAVNTKGTGTVVTRTVKAGTGVSANILTKTVFDFSSIPVVSDGIRLIITWPEEISPDLHRAYAEVRLQPKQDS